MKPTFTKLAFSFELVLLLLASTMFGSIILDDTSKKNRIKEAGIIDYISGKQVYFLNKEEILLIHGFTTKLIDYSAFNQLQRGDTISYTHRKIRRGGQAINYLTKKIEPLAMSSKHGSILKYKDYLAEKNSTFRLILVFLFGGLFIIMIPIILYSWFLALLLYLFPTKYAHLETHLLVQHKIFAKDLP